MTAAAAASLIVIPLLGRLRALPEFIASLESSVTSASLDMTNTGDEKEEEGSGNQISRRRDDDDNNGDHRDSKRRRRKHKDDDSISSDADSSSYERSKSRRKRDKKEKKRKHSKKHAKRSSRDLSSSDDDKETKSHSSNDDEGRSRDRRKKRKRKHHKSRSSSRRDDSSSSSEDDEDRRRRRKKSNKKDKNRKREKKQDEDNGLPTFGKYGVVKLADMPKKERSFNIWMEQVKGVPAFSGPKWELQNYFKEYMEDFNTATLPHMKYYDYDKWEMEEYQKQKAGQEEGTLAQQDEARHYQEMRDRAKTKHEEDLAMVKSMMSKEKVDEMKHKAQMQSEMAHAFKMGDQETFQKLKRRLEPEK
jgi:hypothetical protein